MMNNENPIIKFRLHSIESDFIIIGYEYRHSKKIDIQTQLEFKADISRNLIGFQLIFEFKQNKKLLMILKVLYLLELSKSTCELFKSDNDTLKMPTEFLEDEINSAIDVSQGVLHVKTQGTIYATVRLPIIDPKIFLVVDEKKDSDT